MIKNKEDLKNIQVVCRNDKDIEKYSKILKELGFEVVLYNKYKVFYYSTFFEKFSNRMEVDCHLDTYFFNKKFIKILQKFIKEKEEQEKEKKEKIKDIEVASDGRIMKINNKQSEKKIFVAYEYGSYNQGNTICLLKQNYIDFVLKYGLAYETKEARDRALFKLEIETKLKNIAERLNKGRKIDFTDEKQTKFGLCADYRGCDCGSKNLSSSFMDGCKIQGVIYCLDKNFLDVAKKEIGEENLIKYFKEDFN